MARTYTTVGWEDGTVLQPAKVNVQGTEYNVEPQVVSGQTPINATNLRKMDNEIKTIVEQDIPSVLDVKLIAVTDTAPSECATGDKYYNTETNKIYEAVDTNTWDTTGETPIEGISYVVFETQTSYAYNGTSLVSVGGGSGSSDIVIIGDETEATEDTKLIIEEDDMNLDLQGSDFLNEYSESTEKGYSCDYNNKAFGGTILWTNPNPTSDFASQTLNINLSNYDIIEVYYRDISSDNLIQSSGKIIVGNGAKILNHTWLEGVGEAIFFRVIRTTISTVLVEPCYACKISDGTITGQVNNCIIPLYVIGYKTGLFS